MENCKKILQQGLQELDITMDDKQLESLLAFIKLMEKWNKAYNLTAVRHREEMARLHILDSLAVLPHVKGEHVADIGTGAGLPGIPLALFLPHVQFTLIDSNSKKTRFVQQAILELNLKNVTVIHSRVENIDTEHLFSTVIMRAFANLADILKLTSHLIEKQGVLLAMKGQIPEKELIDCKEKHTIIGIKVPGVEAERCLIKIEGVADHG